MHDMGGPRDMRDMGGHRDMGRDMGGPSFGSMNHMGGGGPSMVNNSMGNNFGNGMGGSSMGGNMGQGLGSMGRDRDSQGGGQGLNPYLTLKVILTSEEVQYLFGSDSILLKQLRQQTGANINVTDPGPHERVLSIAGALDTIFKAFSLVCRKLFEFVMGLSDPTNPRPLVLRLAVPAVQCGSIIGKQGAKIKEIRELTD